MRTIIRQADAGMRQPIAGVRQAVAGQTASQR